MLLVLKGVIKHFRVGRYQQEVLAGVNLTVSRGEVVALVGASGAGKTTLLHIIAGLLAADGGEAFFAGNPLPLKETRQGREQMSLVFQDPYAALSPHLKVSDIVGEPLIIRRKPRQNVVRAVAEALHAVGLHPAEAYLRRYPHQLSGGQRQRVALARALVISPVLLLADEPTSMLDVSVGVEILNLLRSLAEKGMSILLTTHDLAAACYVADRLVVMAEGRVVDEGPPSRLVGTPSCGATRELLEAAM